jgi:hypothetical protein
MSVVTEISFLCDNTILRATASARVDRRASGFVQVGMAPPKFRLARDPTGAFQWRTESEGKRWVSARTSLMPGAL